MLAPATVVQNRYRIVRQLGQGGMGTVYEAIDERLDTTVALKESHFSDERLAKQFEREARLLARLRHPAMTRVIDHFAEADGQFLVMDYVAGADLWEMMPAKGGGFPPAEVLDWADQLLDALTYLHKQDPPVIHRDIKPQNLKLSDSGQVILLDFGLAKGFAGQISRVTTSGSIFGYTPNYAPLEQIQGTGTDPRSDLYSLAATLYHLMTGTMPPDVLTRLTATTEGNADPLLLANELNPTVSGSIGEFLKRGMAIARSQRFASATEMRDQLVSLKAANRSVSRQIGATTLPPTTLEPPHTSESAQPDLPPTIAGPPPNTADGARRGSAPLVQDEETRHRTLTEAQSLQLRYWTEFSEFLNRESWLSPQEAQPQYWMAFSVGRKSFLLSSTVHITDKRIGVNLTLSGEQAKAHFHLLHSQIEEIEEEIGRNLSWKERPEGKESHILSYCDADPARTEDWPAQFRWLRKELEAFHETFAPRIADLKTIDYQADENSETMTERREDNFEEGAAPGPRLQRTSAWLVLGGFILLVTVMILMAYFKVLG